MTSATDIKRIALVEDEPDLRENYRQALAQCGYRVDCFADRPTAEMALASELPDLVIIDVGLGADYEGGFALCRQLRAVSAELPILFLSARDSELDVISGLRLGADDYLSKDISLAQLLARVSALFRRADALQNVSVPARPARTGSLEVDEDQLKVLWKMQAVALTVTEFWLVHCLARFPGQVKSRQQLMEAANLVLDDQSITAHIKRIRKKFQAVDAEFSAIQSVYAAGYRWVELTT
ncbi:MAG TPA: proteobacterial dedicated sortase system response regulator [Gammaproteobacteria bacterium]|nr:proteobacterial dedicated sortase system response regulator [Gammaproteobacteria bacterium]